MRFPRRLVAGRFERRLNRFAAVVFVIQREDARRFSPCGATIIDPVPVEL